MNSAVRELIKDAMAVVPPAFLEKWLAISILHRDFKAVRKLNSHPRKEDLWKEVFNQYHDRVITLLEFGVFEGYSINYFSSLNGNDGSRFFGFDSFLGLPEDWSKKYKKGAFDLGGKSPEVSDARIIFRSGWFQNTLQEFLARDQIVGELLVHFDADMYGATLYVLSQLDALKIPYLAIFDEFVGGESRALYDYCRLSGADVRFLSAAVRPGDGRYPGIVACKIEPCAIYSPKP